MKPFLQAWWQDLLMANYEADPEVLRKYVPYRTELDDFEGKCYVSLVGFLFRDTRVLGVPVPGHITFEEFNLRFYVRFLENGVWKRGVVFIREIVPKPAITWVANGLYHEHYATLPMRHHIEDYEGQRHIRYEWKHKGAWQHIRAVTGMRLIDIEPDGLESFITEHYWGYSQSGKAKTTEYEVVHPRWQVRQVLDYEVQCGAKALYGPDFEWLDHAKPASFLAAVGSEVKVMGKKILL